MPKTTRLRAYQYPPPTTPASDPPARPTQRPRPLTRASAVTANGTKSANSKTPLYLLPAVNPAAARPSANRLALGHHSDDVAETVLINMTRGAGLTGMAGIPPVREKIIRPLIQTSRAQIIAYLKSQGLSYRIDQSNDNPKFLRNRIRHQLLPLMESINPNVRKTLIENAATFRELSEYMQDQARLLLPAPDMDSGICLSVEQLSREPQALRLEVLRQALDQVRGNLMGIGQVHLRAIDRLIASTAPNASCDLPGRIQAIRAYDRLVLRPAFKKTEPPVSEILQIPGSVCWPMPEKKVSIKATGSKVREQDIKQGSTDKAYIDLDEIHPPLRVRPFRAGDRIKPLGLSGTKKVKSVLQQIKIPKAARACYPIIEDQKGIVWIPGYRIADHVRLTSKTGNALKLSIET